MLATSCSPELPVTLCHFALILPEQRPSPQWLCLCVCVVELPCLRAGSWDLIQLHCREVCVCVSAYSNYVCLCVRTYVPECQVATWGPGLGEHLPPHSLQLCSVPCVSASCCCCVTVTVTRCWTLHGGIITSQHFTYVWHVTKVVLWQTGEMYSPAMTYICAHIMHLKRKLTRIARCKIKLNTNSQQASLHACISCFYDVGSCALCTLWGTWELVLRAFCQTPSLLG